MSALDLLLVLAVYATQALAGQLALIGAGALGSRWPATGCARWGAALVLGPALLALWMLALHVAGLGLHLPLILAPWWLAGALLGLARWTNRGAATTRAVPAPHAATAGAAAPRARRLLLVGVLAVFGWLTALGLLVPVHTGDSLRNFALEARVFETQRAISAEGLNALLFPGRIEYPPLLPLNEAAIFLATASDELLAIKPFFALGWLGLSLLALDAALAVLAPALAGAALALLTLALGVSGHATEGYADLRLAAGLLLLALAGRALWRAPSLGAALLYAACAATCALTKVEGLSLALAATALLPLAAARAGLAPRHLWIALLVLLAASLAWPAFAARAGIGSFYFTDESWYGGASTAARLPVVLQHFVAAPFAREVSGLPSWGALWPAALLVAVLALRDPGRRREILTLLALLAAHAALYVAVVTLSPWDVRWHLNVAGPRLMLHLTPWALLLLCAALRAPRASLPALSEVSEVMASPFPR